MSILRRGSIKNVVNDRIKLGWYDHLLECTKDLDNIKILALGGEIPLVTEALKHINITLHIMDLPGVCKAGRSMYPEVEYFEDLKLVDDKYDIITSYLSLMYVDSLEETLEIYRSRNPQYLVFGHVIATEEKTYIAKQGKVSYRIYNMKDIIELLPNFELVKQDEYPLDYKKLRGKLNLKEDTPIKSLNFYFRNKEL